MQGCDGMVMQLSRVRARAGLLFQVEVALGKGQGSIPGLRSATRTTQAAASRATGSPAEVEEEAEASRSLFFLCVPLLSHPRTWLAFFLGVWRSVAGISLFLVPFIANGRALSLVRIAVVWRSVAGSSFDLLQPGAAEQV